MQITMYRRDEPGLCLPSWTTFGTAHKLNIASAAAIKKHLAVGRGDESFRATQFPIVVYPTTLDDLRLDGPAGAPACRDLAVGAYSNCQVTEVVVSKAKRVPLARHHDLILDFLARHRSNVTNGGTADEARSCGARRRCRPRP